MAGRFLSGCFCGKEILPKIAALPAFSLIFSQLFTHTLGRRARKLPQNTRKLLESQRYD
jgi:hypothetical protein